jgi:hypothetical protein
MDDLNCKLVTHTSFSSGKHRVEVTEVHASSRENCRKVARSRELSSHDESILKIKVFFSWREPRPAVEPVEKEPIGSPLEKLSEF